jgi:hypothetical protein
MPNCTNVNRKSYSASSKSTGVRVRKACQSYRRSRMADRRAVPAGHDPATLARHRRERYSAGKDVSATPQDRVRGVQVREATRIVLCHLSYAHHRGCAPGLEPGTSASVGFVSFSGQGTSQVGVVGFEPTAPRAQGLSLLRQPVAPHAYVAARTSFRSGVSSHAGPWTGPPLSTRPQAQA